ncbi:hypothetical protein TCDM_04003 [Trypanosoma cruzi Dm28c]|uniref:Uncharacterized protein n=1 Tax=Trypanosoma cruzi Dm28c TaxID=1416333 RepID=V5BHZ5_TRYCR|nr:hypothetical protein TCDM_04003 [Trypanosoma cruzi Dm28c]
MKYNNNNNNNNHTMAEIIPHKIAAVGNFLFGDPSAQNVLFGMGISWLILALYGLYYLFKRSREVMASTMAPFIIFMDYLTDGATAGYDKPLMSLLHPELLENVVERGLIRAMARCLCKQFGKVEHIPRDTVMMRSRCDDVNFVALVDFQHAKRVKCRMSWRWRSSGDVFFQKAGLVRSFYITGFLVEPRPEEQFDVLNFLHTEDFVPFAESFVEKLFEQSPKAAVMMMVPALQERYMTDLEKLQRSIERVCGISQGSQREVDAKLVSEVILRAPALSKPPGENTDRESGDKDGGVVGGGSAAASANDDSGDMNEKEAAKTAVRGIEMRFVVNGVGRREMEVTVVLSFSGLRCYVSRYEVRARPDPRTQVLLDHDTGERTIVT